MSIDGFPNRALSSSKVVTSTTRPPNPLVGMIIYEADTKIAYMYTGNSWREISAPRYAALLYRSTDLAVAGGFASTAVPMNALSWADDNVVFQGGANYTCPIAGMYEVVANIETDSPGILSAIGLSFGGASIEGMGNMVQNGPRATRLHMTHFGSMAAGGVISTYIWNDGDVATAIREGSQFTWLNVRRIGPRHDSGAAA